MTVVAGGGVESVKKTASLLVRLSEIAKQSTTRQTVVASQARLPLRDHTHQVDPADSRSPSRLKNIGRKVKKTLGLGTAMMMNMLPTAMMAAITGQWIIMTVVAGGGVESVKKTARLLVTLSEIAKQSTTRQTVVASPAKVISGDHTLLVALVDSRSRIPSVMPRKL